MPHHNIAALSVIDTHAHVFDPNHPYAPGRAYTPGPALLDTYLKAAESWNMDKVVLVQPSPYGTDNTVLRQSLSRLGTEKARGVAVINNDTSLQELEDLVGSGVVGVRINLEAGAQTDTELLRKSFIETVEKVAAFNLLIELYVDAKMLEPVQPLLAQSPVPIVLDHFAGLKADRGPGQEGLETVIDLLKGGNIWVKFSGPYRANVDSGGWNALGSLIQALVDVNDRRLVWASDWPHTGGGKDRLNRKVTDIEPFRKHDASDYLQRTLDWVEDSAKVHQLLESNPTELFRF